jgi:hypothetical protein
MLSAHQAKLFFGGFFRQVRAGNGTVAASAFPTVLEQRHLLDLGSQPSEILK